MVTQSVLHETYRLAVKAKLEVDGRPIRSMQNLRPFNEAQLAAIRDAAKAVLRRYPQA